MSCTNASIAATGLGRNADPPVHVELVAASSSRSARTALGYCFVCACWSRHAQAIRWQADPDRRDRFSPGLRQRRVEPGVCGRELAAASTDTQSCRRVVWVLFVVVYDSVILTERLLERHGDVSAWHQVLPAPPCARYLHRSGREASALL